MRIGRCLLGGFLAEISILDSPAGNGNNLIRLGNLEDDPIRTGFPSVARGMVALENRPVRVILVRVDPGRGAVLKNLLDEVRADFR